MCVFVYVSYNKETIKRKKVPEGVLSIQSRGWFCAINFSFVRSDATHFDEKQRKKIEQLDENTGIESEGVRTDLKSFTR